MDDLKLYGRNDQELENLVVITKKFSEDISMKFGLEKCAKVTFHRGKLTKTSDIQLENDKSIKELDFNETYKYLGVHEGGGGGIHHSKMKESIRKEYMRRVKLITRTELNAQNKFEAINTLAIPVITYSFNVINVIFSGVDKGVSNYKKYVSKF